MRSSSLLVVSLLVVGCGAREPAPRRAPPGSPPTSALPSATGPHAKNAKNAKMVREDASGPATAGGEEGAGSVAKRPAEAPYDLAADRQRRIDAAKAELGPRVATSVVSDVFVVVGPKGWQGDAFDRSVALMRSAMAGFMNGRFGKKPSQAISVYLFPEAQSYESFCTQKFDAPCIAHFGFYTPGERYMVMNAGLGLGTLTHELVHPLVEADFPGAPTWINEGIASVFEQPLIPKPGEIHGGKNWRHPRLKRALQLPSERDAARLDALFGMSDETFRGDKEDLNYAAARYVCQWLDERGKLWPFYQKWRDNRADDPTGEKAFRDVVGMTPGEAHPIWVKWVLAL